MVIEANPRNYINGVANGSLSLEDAFWMRTIAATGCHNFQLGGIPDERQGIVYYKKGSTAYPFTARPNYDITCHDEPYNKLQPVLSSGWTVKPVDISSKLTTASAPIVLA